MRQFSSSVKKFAVLAGAATALATLPVLAGNMPAPNTQTQAPASDRQTQPQGEAQPMTPSSSPARTRTTSGDSIVDVAVANGSFKTLTAALKAAGLDKTLASGGPYTVFAPTDAAFAALPQGTVEQLLQPENREALVKILTYHVVQGEKTSSSLQSGETKTLEGAPVQVKVSSTGVTVNGAKVVQPDIQASNGVIHVIDKVILPPRG
jgi:uncharacterized surface protein with fasciclin (FAS1) repeats